MSSEIAVELLGPPQVELPGEPVHFEGAEHRRLFLLLALRAPDAVSADDWSSA